MPTAPTETDAINAENASSSAYSSWTTAHTTTLNAQTALTTAQNNEAPALAALTSTAQAAVTKALGYEIGLLTPASTGPNGIEIVNVLLPAINAALGVTLVVAPSSPPVTPPAGP